MLLFIRNSYVGKQETFYFTSQLVQLVPKSTNLTNGEYYFMRGEAYPDIM